MLIYQIQKRKKYSHWLLVGPATDRRARCTSCHVLYMYKLDFDLRNVQCNNVCMNCAMCVRVGSKSHLNNHKRYIHNVCIIL